MTTWVLLRGLSREAAHWHDLPARLAERTGHRMMTPDLPGVGSAAGRRAPWTVAGIARDVGRRVGAELESVRATGADPGRVCVLGHSLGGMVAMRWAAMARAEAMARVASGADPDVAAGGPELPRVDRLVVIGSSLGRLSPPWRRIGLGRLPTMLQLAATRPPRRREELVLDLTSSIGGRRREDTLDEREVVARERPVPTMVSVRQLIAATAEPGPRPEDLPMPMLVVVGRADTLVDPRCSYALAHAFGASLHQHETAAHDVPLDAPAWLVDRLAAFDPGDD